MALADLERETVKLEQLEHVPQCSMHEGHDPAHPSTLLVETIAMVMCSGCSGGDLRFRDDRDRAFYHCDPIEATDCDASDMLNAALEIGVPLYTGADLEFPEDDA